MMTKTAFFALLNDKENRIGVTAHVAVYNDANGNTCLIISQNGAPNAWLSNHKSDTALQSAFTKYNTWLNEWFTAQANAVRERAESINDFLTELEADHAEGEAVVAAINNDIDAGIAHAEALEINEAFNIAVSQACCFSDLDSATPNSINNATSYVRQRLLEMNRYTARFIVSMMGSVSRRAKAARAAAKVKHQEMLERCATATTDQISSEIPF